MSVRALILIACLWAGLAQAQGFAGLGTNATGFAIPERGRVLSFPKDHGSHPTYRIEWWYITANLKDAAGRDYGVQWTLFRSALRPEEGEAWQSPQIWMGHAGLTTPDRHFVAERLARGGIGQAGVRAAPFEAWIDDWSLAGPNFDQLVMRATGADFGFDLSLEAEGPLVLHGDQGYSVKSGAGQASYYYSQPRYKVSGELDLPDGKVAVTGDAWLDREWSSQPLASDQTGWDWFSLRLEDGPLLMAFRLRGDEAFTSGTWITETVQPIGNGAITVVPLRTHKVAGREVPIAWRLRYPAEGLDLEITAINPDAWMALSVPYWEGPVRVSGSHGGIGYLEMTGYE